MDEPNPQPNDWRGHLTDELKADPVVSSWAEKASEKDIGSIIKGYAHAQKRMGSAINLPGKDAKPEELTALRTKLMESGVIAAPPAKPEEYGLADPGNLPDGVKWSPELAGKFASVLHKHGVPKAAVADLLPVYLEAIHGQATALKTDAQAKMDELRKEHGEKFDERWELADRLAKDIFKSEEEINFFAKSGAGPLLYGPLLRLSHLASQDSSYIDSLGSSPVGGTPQEVQAELQKVLTDKTHPHYAGIHGPTNTEAYRAADAYLQGLYEKAFPKQGATV